MRKYLSYLYDKGNGTGSWVLDVFMLLEPAQWASRTTCRPHASIADEVLSWRGRWGEFFWLSSIDVISNRKQHVCLMPDMNQLNWSMGKHCLVPYLLLYRGILRWLNCSARVWVFFSYKLETVANWQKLTVTVDVWSEIHYSIYKYEQFSIPAPFDLSSKSNWGVNELKWSYETCYLWNHWLMPLSFPFHISGNTKCK